MHKNLEAEVKLITQHTFFIGPNPFSKSKITSAFTDYKNLFIDLLIDDNIVVLFYS